MSRITIETVERINPDFKVKLVNFLKSPNFKKIRGGLKDSNNGYCLYGAILHLAAVENIAINSISLVEKDTHFYSRGQKITFLPSIEVTSKILGTFSVLKLKVSIDNEIHYLSMLSLNDWHIDYTIQDILLSYPKIDDPEVKKLLMDSLGVKGSELTGKELAEIIDKYF